MNAFPPWLKAHQHGSIGEARTRAFLLDRFWILERSVDIHGVDFIIQRRLYGRDILDPAPPRFGVVQAKFVQDERTTQKVSKDLVLDEEGQPRFEAFVLVHTGDEETQEMFLLSASDIQRDFECQEERFLLPAKVLLSSGKYVVQSKKLALDRIEYAVRCADFYKNRMFIFRELPSEVPDFDAIVPEYKEEMEYWFGSIPEVFRQRKKQAYETMGQIQRLHALLRKFCGSVDPIEAVAIAEELQGYYGRTLSIPELFDKELYNWSKFHRERVENLRAEGALDNFLLLRKHVARQANEFLQAQVRDDIKEETLHRIVITYDVESLRLEGVSSSLCHGRENELCGEFGRIVEACEGEVILIWRLGLQVTRRGVMSMSEWYLNEIVDKIYGLKYCEDEEV